MIPKKVKLDYSPAFLRNLFIKYLTFFFFLWQTLPVAQSSELKNQFRINFLNPAIEYEGVITNKKIMVSRRWYWLYPKFRGCFWWNFRFRNSIQH